MLEADQHADMLQPPPLYVPLLSAAVVLTYVAAIWRLLRSESRWTLLALLLIVAVGASIRAHQFPPLHIDETLTLECTRDDYEHGRLFDDNCNKISSLPIILFELPLVPWFGPDVVAIRAYSFLASCAATLVMFGLIRIMGGTATAGLWAATTFALLPWSIFYARVYQGGELALNQLLLLAVLACAIWRRMQPADAWIGAVAFCLSFYTYWSSRCVFALPLLACLLAKGWKNRMACLLVWAFGVAGAVPFLSSDAEHARTGLSLVQVGNETLFFQAGNFSPLLEKVTATLTTFWLPLQSDGWLSHPHAGIHPPLLLLLAVAGTVRNFPFALFLGASFILGLTPAVFGFGAGPSTHRLTFAYAVVPLAAAHGLDILRSRRHLHLGVALFSLAVIAYQALGLYFSPRFQAGMNRWYDTTRTAVIRDFPADELILTAGLWGFAEVRKLDLGEDHIRLLTPNNWLTADSYHAICASALLAGFYSDLLGEENVRTYPLPPSPIASFSSNYCFLAHVPAGVWEGQRHGWQYTIHCDAGASQTAVLPTLFHRQRAHYVPACPDQGQRRRLTWETRWVGKEAHVEFYGTEARFEVSVDAVSKAVEPWTVEPFVLQPGSIVRVSTTHLGHLMLGMNVKEDSGNRLARWSETERMGTD